MASVVGIFEVGTRNGHDDDPFIIWNGFLALSGKIYWEERVDCEPTFHVLVVGRLDADTFHGKWLSSKDMQTGKFTKFIQRCYNENHKVDVLASDIV